MRRHPSIGIILSVLSLIVALGSPAVADHTNPREKQASTEGDPAGQAETQGEGTWEIRRNLKANPGTDLFIFKLAGRTYSSSGTLGQANAEHVGQRMLRLLTRRGKPKVRWVADHASAKCPTANPSGTTGLQHDVQVTPRKNAKLLIDTTDATGRCHDSAGGGLELVDISGLHKGKDFEPREIHLTRHTGTSHNVTVDATRPWIVYNSSSSFANTALAYIDVLDIRSCLLPRNAPLEKKRKSCRPKVYRMTFQPGWTAQTDTLDGEPREGTDSSCHDIVARPGRIYCSGLSGEAILDVSGLTDASGAIKGKPLPCKVVDGTLTEAKVTDCVQAAEDDSEAWGNQAAGWKLLGNFNHPGRNCGDPQAPPNCNNNVVVPAAEGIAVSHETVPTPDNKYMFVTDERGGGIVPGGASCEGGNPYSNGGVHVFDISDPSKIEYAMTPDDQKAVFIGNVVVPSPTFCTAHRMELIPGEQRFVIAWYTQGTKIVDYFIDAQGRWTFRETASIILPGANTWATSLYKTKINEDGSKTYWFIASDIGRGIDIFRWTGPPNPNGTPPPAEVPRQVVK